MMSPNRKTFKLFSRDDGNGLGPNRNTRFQPNEPCLTHPIARWPTNLLRVGGSGQHQETRWWGGGQQFNAMCTWLQERQAQLECHTDFSCLDCMLDDSRRTGVRWAANDPIIRWQCGPECRPICIAFTPSISTVRTANEPLFLGYLCPTQTRHNTQQVRVTMRSRCDAGIYVVARHLTLCECRQQL